MQKTATTLAVIMFMLPGSTMAQTAPTEQFLAVDFSGGIFVPKGPTTEENKWDIDGWQVDSTVRFRRWIGVTGAVARHTENGMPVNQFLAGPRFSTGYFSYGGMRLFAHVLGGVAHGGTTTVSETGPVVIAGGGADIFGVFRLQGDYVRLDFSGRRRNNGRVFIGAVVPLCFRGCGVDDWFDVSKRGEP